MLSYNDKISKIRVFFDALYFFIYFYYFFFLHFSNFFFCISDINNSLSDRSISLKKSVVWKIFARTSLKK